MSPLFGRGGGDAGRERSEADREAARLEREARRAQREGRAAQAPKQPPGPAATPEPEPPAAAPDLQEPGPEPVAPVVPEPEPDPEPVAVPDFGPEIEAIDLTPPPPQVVSPPPRRSPPPGRQVPPPPPAPRPIDAAAAGVAVDHDEQPIGVRRVSVPEVPPRVPEERSRYVTPGVPRVPRSRRGARRIWAILALALVAGLVWFAVELFQPFKGDGGEAITVRIPAGAGAGTIADLLAERDVVASSFFFRLRARLAGGTLTSGTHVMRRDMPYGAALTELGHNPPAPKVLRLTIPEGLSRREAAPLVAQSGIKGSYLAASLRTPGLSLRRYGAPKGTPSLEGFLFPATYELKPGASARRLVGEQADAFERNLAKVSLRAARRKNLTVYDVVTIASMIEREAQADRDRRLVSAVIYNRLKQRIPLGIDATIRYQLKNWSRPLRVSELQRDTPYNTRLHQGLPPTPVGNPGLASIRAAANPAKVSYLYYVVKPCGNGDHAFSSTDAQFQRDVKRYNDARAKRGGKDPSRC